MRLLVPDVSRSAMVPIGAPRGFVLSHLPGELGHLALEPQSRIGSSEIPTSLRSARVKVLIWL